MGFNYDVFLSYRHRPLDGEITKKVFNALESYKIPKALRKKGYEDIRRVFRDTEELSVSKILTETIDDALRSTNCLVVVCTLDAPLSPWVDREVSMFIQMGRAEHIYPLLVNGDPERSFPPSLKRIPDVMDRLMDVRSPGDDPKKIMARAETELLKVIAGVTGCDEEELAREHHHRRNRRFALRTGAAAAAFLAVAGISLGLMRQASDYRDTARQREAASLRILSELTYDLPDRLTNVPGAYRRIADILRGNTEDLNAILLLSTDAQAAKYEAAANYEKLATAGSVLGAYEDALASEETAIGLFRDLAESGYERGGPALASAYNNRGSLLKSIGRYHDAAADYARAIEELERTAEPDMLTLARMHYNAGSCAVSAGENAAAAAEHFTTGLELLSALPATAEVLLSEAQASYNYGVLLYREGDYRGAEERLTDACDRYALMTEIGDSLRNRSDYAQAAASLAACLTDQGRLREADERYAQAARVAEALAADTENMEYQYRLAELYNNWGICANVQGDYARADGYYTRAVEQYRTVMERTGALSDAAVYALSLLNTGENAFKAGDYARSKALFEDGLDRYARICTDLGTYDTAQYYTWRSYYELIHARDAAAALDAALNAVELLPDSVLANLNLAYACLYCGYYDDADYLFAQIAALGRGQAETIRLDLEAQERAGMTCEHIPAVLETLSAGS